MPLDAVTKIIDSAEFKTTSDLCTRAEQNSLVSLLFPKTVF